MPADPVPVRWEVADDDDFSDLVCHGDIVADAHWAHSVHVDVTGLRPGRWYSYRFVVGDQVSPVGRTRTAPAAGHGRGALRYLFASCQNWQSGYWPLWAQAPDDEPDVVLHLGDYIYEGGISAGGVRRHNSGEIRDLAAYRNRYGLYKGDPGPAGRPRRLPVDRHVGRPRGREQLRRPGGAGPDRGARLRGPSGRRLPGLVGAHAGASAAARHRHPDPPPVRLGNPRPVPRRRHPPVPRSAGVRRQPRPHVPRPHGDPGAPCSGPSRSRGWPRDWPGPPPPGTSSPTRS